jgi:hypothetical protein
MGCVLRGGLGTVRQASCLVVVVQPGIWRRLLERAREIGAAGDEAGSFRPVAAGAREKLAAYIATRLANGCDTAASLSVGTKTCGSRLPLKCLLGD